MKPTRIIVHHSATKDSGTVSWGTIRDYHVRTNGWLDIGYHWGVELIGHHYEVLLGRWWDQPGAHTIGENNRSLGICVVGNYDEDLVPGELETVVCNLISHIQKQFGIPNFELYGHRDFAKKSCPGENLYRLIQEIKRNAL